MKNMLVIAVFILPVFFIGCAGRNSDSPFAAYAHDEYTSDMLITSETGPDTIELAETASLNTYLAYAAQNNPGLEAAFNRWKAAVERIAQAKSLPDPRLTYRYYISEIETRVGPMRQSLGLSQTFPWLGKLELQGDVAAELAKAERLRFEAARLKLFYELIDAYCEYYYLGKSIGIVKDNLNLLQRTERVARSRYKTAQVSHPDVIRAQVEIGKLEDRLNSLQNLRRPIQAKLNAVLNRPANEELSWPSELPQQQGVFTDNQLQAWLGESNPQLKAMDSEKAAAAHQIELAKQQYLPDITLGVDYTDIGDSTGGRHPSDDGKDALAVMASINLPIWYDKLAAGVREARFRQQAANLARSQQANDLDAALKLAMYRYHDAQRKIELRCCPRRPKRLWLPRQLSGSARRVSPILLTRSVCCWNSVSPPSGRWRIVPSDWANWRCW